MPSVQSTSVKTASALHSIILGWTRGPIDNYGNGPMEHAAAMEVWAEFRDAHIPGLCFSDRPRHLSIPRERLIDGRILPGVAHIGIGDREMDESRWGEIDEYVRHLPFHGERDIVPAKWTYRDIIPAGHVHSIHDEPNPRYYGLDGCMIRQAFNVGAKKIARNYCDGFEARLCILFDDAPMNERQAAIEARLNHHLDHGGNPSAFMDYVDTIPRKWDEEPPLILTGSTSMLSTLGVKPLPDAFLLTKYIREWLVTGRKRKPTPELVPLEKRFPKRSQYLHFISLLIESEILDDAGKYKPSKLGRGRMFGAYTGAASKLKMSIGNDRERVLVLNGAFKGLDISIARPQDLYGKTHYDKMFKAFRDSKWPS